MATQPNNAITGAAEATHPLIELVDRYRTVLQATHDVLWDWDLESDVVVMNEAVRVALGHDFDPTQTTTTWWSERVHPEDLERVQAKLRALLASDESRWQDEYRFRRGDGSYAIVFDRGAVLRENGRAVRMVGAMTDITAMRDSEAALAHRTAELRAITGAYPDIYFWADASGHIVDYLAGRDADLAMPPSAFLGKRTAELFPGELGQRLEAAAQECLRTGEVVALEYKLEIPRGIRCYEVRYVPVAHERVIAIVRDITQRREAEEDVRRRDEQYRLVTDGVPVLIGYVDRDGCYRFVNRAYEQMFATPREAFIGSHLSKFLEPSAYAQIQPFVERVLAGEAVSFEKALVIAGRTRHVTVSYVPHRADDGSVQGFFALIVDVTEQRLLEQQLRHAQKMEAIGRLAGGIAHDFNNLLMVIGTATELARRALATGRDATADLATIGEATARAGELTRQLLAFGRPDESRRELVDVDGTVRATEKMLRRVIGEDVLLEMALASEGTPVRADRGQLEQVIMNLAVNARDAMPAGGTLSLRTARVAFGENALGLAPGVYVELAVGDTGIGMHDSVRRRVFEPFFTTKDIDKGTGLGLAMVYGIATQHRGTVTVDSTPGAGTTFRVYLPAADGAATAATASTPTPQPRAHERVLLVEDEAAVRTLVRRALEEAGYAVAEAADGPAALALLDANEPVDVLVTDVIMPRLSGRVLVERFRARRPGLPVLFVSGYPEQHMNGIALEPGTTAFLPKPFTIEDLLVKLRQLLDRDQRPA